MSALSDYDKNWCTHLLNELMRWPLTTPFRVPVDPVRDGADHYFEIIAHPMDLTTMKKKLSDNEYKNVQAFIDDVHLICNNSTAFNGEDSMYGYIAHDVKKYIDDQYKEKASSVEDEWQKKLENVVNRLHDHVQKAPIVSNNNTSEVLSPNTNK